MNFSLLYCIHMADSGTFPDGSDINGLNKRGRELDFEFLSNP